MAVNEVRHYGPDNQINFPVTGGGSVIPKGALLKPGTTDGTNLGLLIPATGSTEAVSVIGLLQQASVVANDSTATGTVFTTYPIDILTQYRTVRMEISQASGDSVACTQAVTTTTMTVTNSENTIGGSFVYVTVGTGIGQTNFVTASASGSFTLKAAFGTSLDTTSKYIKIPRRFHSLIFMNSDGTKMASQAAASSMRGLILDIFIVRNGEEHPLNPVNDSAYTGLNSLASLKFYADVALIEPGPYVLV